jgi:hypothetical protein
MNKNMIATPKATKPLPQKIQIFLHFLILSPHLIPASLYSLSPINYPLSLSLPLSLSPLSRPILITPLSLSPSLRLFSPLLSLATLIKPPSSFPLFPPRSPICSLARAYPSTPFYLFPLTKTQSSSGSHLTVLSGQPSACRCHMLPSFSPLFALLPPVCVVSLVTGLKTMDLSPLFSVTYQSRVTHPIMIARLTLTLLEPHPRSPYK